MPSRFKTAFETEGKGANAPFLLQCAVKAAFFPFPCFFEKTVILSETKKMTHAYSIDMPSSDDTDWILMDFNEPAAKSGNVRDKNVRDKKTTPLSRKPVKKTCLKKPQVKTGKTSRNTAEKAGKLKAANLKTASGKKRQRTRNPNSKQNRKTKV